MPRFARIVPVVLLALGSQAAVAQEVPDAAQALSEARRGISIYASSVQARATELGRKIDVLTELTDAADSVSVMATGQSLTRARNKAEEAKKDATRDPALDGHTLAVVDSVLELVNRPPLGMPADQLRAKLFVEISKLEEEILRQCDAFLGETRQIEFLETSLERLRGTLHNTAIAGQRASLLTRRRALKGVP
ncbi:MAG TPA: hypothetical protein VGM86_08480 [Thermoanaerobaculia bacterium]|jgi:hypothetical protein